LIQVAGRAGREEANGEVIVQTHHPDHPLLVMLLKKGYRKFSELALDERKSVGLPPYQFMGLLRAECKTQSELQSFLQQARALAEQFTDFPIQIFGPINAPLAKRAQLFRGQLLLQATHRKLLHTFLEHWLLQLPNKIHWTLDIDPLDFN